MRILFFGDVVGRSGRDALTQHLPTLRQKLQPDVVIVNAENTAGGYGLTLKIAQELFTLGIHCLTTGNHVWDQKELVNAIGGEPRILRPANYPDGTPGRGHLLHTLPDGRKILILHSLGRLFMDPFVDDPFALMDKMVTTHRLGHAAQAIFVDFHAEATSEKMAMGQFLDGRASAVVGSHTHIPSADGHILVKGTAYQTDAGMCGDYDSVIGMRKELSLWRFTKKIPGERMVPAEGEATLCGCFVVTNDTTGLADSITPVRVGGRLQQTAL